jgi:GTPase SAR1 family protein
MDIESIIKDLVKDLAAKALNKTVEVGNTQYKKALVKLELCFTNYLARSYDRFSKIKTLLYRDRPVSLKSHYVCTDFQLVNKEVNGKVIFDSFQTNKKNVVVGTAGSGKSVLLRKLFSDLIENKCGYVPILIELRLLITPTGHVSIFDFIHTTLSSLDENFTAEQLHFALKKGKVALFLDGFDEIDFNKKEEYEREILDISNKYSNSIVVVSSRPDECFSSWEEFHIYRTKSLNKEQSIDLVNRIEYDPTVKNKFISELKDGLYEKHKDFLSNPLLLTMMLLTYEQLAEIPEKVHIFYEQAFDTLYHKHDALKSLYKRKSYSELPIDDFKRIFSAFCIITYTERKISFNYQELICFLNNAIEIEGIEVEANKFFNDLVKSVCIIQKDGNNYTFSHRSFQEYFAAFYLSKSQSLDLARVLDNMVSHHFSDNVLKILFELNREKVEKDWVIPRLKELLSKTTPILDSGDVLSFLKLFYIALSRAGSGLGLQYSDDLPMGYFLTSLRRLYPEISNECYPINDEDDEKLEAEKFEKGQGELTLYIENTIAEDYNAIVLLTDLDSNVDWLRDTWIVEGCYKYQKTLETVYEELTNKYEKKSSSLSSILFG